jgi:hypothetical protein
MAFKRCGTSLFLVILEVSVRVPNLSYNTQAEIERTQDWIITYESCAIHDPILLADSHSLCRCDSKRMIEESARRQDAGSFTPNTLHASLSFGEVPWLGGYFYHTAKLRTCRTNG